MGSELKELWRFRELLFTMVERDLKIRYKNSALGFLWSLLNPLITVIVMSFVLGQFIYGGVSNLTAYLLAAYLPFTFFQFAVLDSAQTVLGAMPLIKKIYFPRELLPIASVISNFIHLLLALVVFFVYLIIVWLVFPGHFPIQWTVVYLPVLLGIAFAMALGLAFIVSALNTFYEDVKYITSAVLQLLFFLCPVMYFSEMVANSSLNQKTNGLIYKLYHLNPVATLASAFRKTIIAPPQSVPTPSGKVAPLPLDWSYVGLAAAISVLVLVGGYAMFNRMKWRFVERP